MTFADDILDDRDIFFDDDEMGTTASSTYGDFIVINGDSILHADDHKTEVFEENVQAMVKNDDPVVIQLKKLDLITIYNVIYEVVNLPVLDNAKTGISFIPLRRQTETRI